MGLSKKDWFFVLLTLALLGAGIALFWKKDYYQIHKVKDLRKAQIFKLSPSKKGVDSIVIRLHGHTRGAYNIRLAPEIDSSQRQVENISLPSGEIHAVFRRKIKAPKAGFILKYIPGKGAPGGYLNIETLFF